MARTATAPSVGPARRWRLLPALGGGLVAALVLAGGLGDVVFLYSTAPNVSGTASPLRFIDGADYASANAEGFLTVAFTTTQQVSFTTTLHAADGAYGSYLLDMIEVQGRTNTTTGWHLALSVTQAMSGSGINAAYVFYCTTAPTGVGVTGTPLASGTDAAGDAWAVFAPTCTGTSESLSLLATGAGAAVALTSLSYGTSVLYLSFAVDVASGGTSGTMPATVLLSASSP